MGWVSCQEDIQERKDDAEHGRRATPNLAASLAGPKTVPLVKPKIASRSLREPQFLPYREPPVVSKQEVERFLEKERKALEPVIKISKSARKKQLHFELLALLRRAWFMSKQQDGWVSINSISDSLHSMLKEFRPSKYGYNKLSDLIRAQSHLFDIKQDLSIGLFIKLKQ